MNTNIDFNAAILKTLAAESIQASAFLSLQQQDITDKTKRKVMPQSTGDRETDLYCFQMSQLKKLFTDTATSNNKFNYSMLNKYEIMENGCITANHFPLKGLHKSRKKIGDDAMLIKKYTTLISLSGFVAWFPIVLSHDMKIIDGYQRYLACCRLNEKIYWIRLNY